MSTTYNIKIQNNDGIVSAGNGNYNTQEREIVSQKIDIEWETLNKEIDKLRLSSDSSIKIFADEAAKVAEKKDKQGILKVFQKWLPCIGKLIESSYYIMGIAKNFNIIS